MVKLQPNPHWQTLKNERKVCNSQVGNVLIIFYTKKKDVSEKKSFLAHEEQNNYVAVYACEAPKKSNAHFSLTILILFDLLLLLLLYYKL